MTPSEESMTLMTSYHFPHHGNRSFAIASGWRLMVFFITAASLRHRFGVTFIVNRHSEWTQECCSRKTGNSNMTPSEESMILMTSYRFPHHGNRSFAIASGWRLMVFDIASGWRLSSVVILNGGKNAVQEKRETGQWHRVKNLWFWWHLTAFLTTGTEPSHSLRMTFNVFLTTTANPLLIFRMTPNGNHMLRLLTHS